MDERIARRKKISGLPTAGAYSGEGRLQQYEASQAEGVTNQPKPATREIGKLHENLDIGFRKPITIGGSRG